MRDERDRRVAGKQKIRTWNLFYFKTREQHVDKIFATAIEIHDLQNFGIADQCQNFY